MVSELGVSAVILSFNLWNDWNILNDWNYRKAVFKHPNGESSLHVLLCG